MASLIEQPARKSEAAPRNAQEEKIALARKGMSAGDNLWKMNAAGPASPVPIAPASHLSGIGASTISGLAPQANAKKADHLAGLPTAVRRHAENMAEGPAKFLALIHERHAKTKEAVSFTSADAAVVMDMPPDRADAAVKALEERGFIRRSYSRLGNLAGYLPGTLA